jgi:hypothetical protein
MACKRANVNNPRQETFAHDRTVPANRLLPSLNICVDLKREPRRSPATLLSRIPPRRAVAFNRGRAMQCIEFWHRTSRTDTIALILKELGAAR